MPDWKYQPARDLGLGHAERVKSLRREGGLLDALVHLLWWSGVGAYLRVCHRFTVVHRERLPAGPPFVLVANHGSHLDALALMAALPRRVREATHPIAAGDTFFESLAVGTFAAFALNALPLWRRRVDLKDVHAMRERLLAMPCGYVLFPEGTRTRTGEPARFKRGVGILVAGTEVPVHPCWIEGAFAALPPGRSLPRPRRVTVRVGEPRSFAAEPDDEAGWTRIAQATEAAVLALARPPAPSG